MLDLLTGLRKIRENIPRKITVYDVLKERREFVSYLLRDQPNSVWLTPVDVLRLHCSLRMSTRIQST